MSLINEALKKAQRARGTEPADLAPPMPGGAGKIAPRRAPPGARQLLLYATGGLVLFVLAVVGTVYFLNRPAKPAGVAAQKAVVPATTTTPSPDAPVVKMPVIAPPPVPPVGAETPPIVAEKPVPPPKAPDPAPAAIETPPPAAPATASTAKQTNPPVTEPVVPATPVPKGLADERVFLYLDALRITAVRLQGNDSRVMINERVFRINDIVDRPLSLRLTKVDSDHLTFTDVNGVAYVKYF